MGSNLFIYDKPLKCINTLCIKREKLLNEILRGITRGNYYSILGPKYSGKTILLHQIMQEIKEINYPQVLCVYIDLADFRGLDSDSLFRQIYKKIITRIKFKEEDAFTEFNNSISRLLQHLPDKKIILTFDNIELIPNYLAKELIKTFRAIFMERGIRKEFNKFIVIIAGAIELFELSVGEGEGSPFNIAKCIILPEFDQQESELLIEQGIERAKVIIEKDAKEMLIEKINGQPYLLQKLCYITVEKVRQENRNTITTKDIKEAIEDYIKVGIRDKIFKSMVKKIEEYPELLETLMDIMDGEKPKLKQVSVDIGKLELTGAVIIKNNEYLVRNDIYGRFLKNYFNYARLGEFFTISGRYDKAIDYFESLAKEEKNKRLSKTQINNIFLSLFNLMYASLEIEKIYDLILKGFYTFLGFDDVRLWILNKEKGCLECKRSWSGKTKGLKMPIPEEDKCPELESFNEEKLIVDEELSKLTLTIPLISQNGEKLGIITAIRFNQGKQGNIKEVELDLLKSFVHQTAIAIENATQFKEREELTKSIHGLYDTANQIISSISKPEAIFQEIVDTIGTLLNAKVCYIGLKEKDGWEIKASYKDSELKGKMYYEGITKEIIETGEIFKAEWVSSWENVEYKGVKFTDWQKTDKKGLKAGVIVPLKVSKNETIGVISAYLSNRDYFLKREITLLEILSSQIAVAIENAYLYKHLQSKLENTHLQLLHSERLGVLGETLLSLAHEIKKPLTYIKGRAQRLSKRVKKDKESAKDLESIEDNINRLTDLVNSWLKHGGLSSPQIKPIDIAKVINEALLYTESEYFSKGIKVIKNFHPDIFQIESDEKQLLQVFMNIIKNAIESMSTGGELTISTDLANEFVIFKIIDTGCGIPKEDIKKVFEPCFTTKDKEEGIGLGMAISRRIVEKNHGGSIRVESELGKGTTFIIKLPIKNKSSE